MNIDKYKRIISILAVRRQSFTSKRTIWHKAENETSHSNVDGAKLQTDHKLHFALGGVAELNNLQPLCRDCNISNS